LARSEAHTEASLRTTLFYLQQLLNEKPVSDHSPMLSIKQGENLLKRNTNKLFGKKPSDRHTRIMVTIPSEVVDQPEMVEQFIDHGMNVARINCAHDNASVWLAMIQAIREIDKKYHRHTSISMDIGGPKIRTAEVPKPIRLKKGDTLHLLKQNCPGKKAKKDKEGNIVSHAHVSCTLSEIFGYLKVGHKIYFDDGKIKGFITEITDEFVGIEIARAGEDGEKLRADKGINLPNSNLKLHGLTETDKENLKFIVKHADIVNFSFVNSRDDVRDLHSYLKSLGAENSIGIVYKIETQNAFNNLTTILLEALKWEKVGVMIARGDLAIETGWDTIGKIQKEMLAICNACHIPIIWATQVLESLAKKGLPSRAEITDTVNATKAECIMLNKGPHILRAIELLDTIVKDMEPYQEKNAPMLPPLKRLQQH